MEPAASKDELKSATTMPGALSVTTHGLPRMQMWSVGNLDSEIQVSVATILLCCTVIRGCIQTTNNYNYQ